MLSVLPLSLCPCLNHPALFRLAPGPYALAQGAEGIIMRPEKRQERLPVHDALAHGTRNPLSVLAKDAILDMQHADLIAEEREAAVEDIQLRRGRAGFLQP